MRALLVRRVKSRVKGNIRPEHTSTVAPRYFAPGGKSVEDAPGVGVVSLSDMGMVLVAVEVAGPTDHECTQ
jgi:hypothetical protein